MLNMKIDIVRAWKDEAYRQSLSEGQQAELLSHPVGDLDEADLAEVLGSDGGGGYSPSSYSAPAAAAAATTSNNTGFSKCCTHSWGLLCDINLFSLDANVLALDHIIGIGSSETQVCVSKC